jgi:hypothetical protein
MRVPTFRGFKTGGDGNVCASEDGIDPSSRQISASPEDRRPPGEPPPQVDPWEEAGKIPAFLDRTNGANAPALGPAGDSLDDFQ